MKNGFHPGFDIRALSDPIGFAYGPGVFGPPCELRKLDAIRPSLRDPDCTGPDPVYAISMDVGTRDRRKDLITRNLLFGAVVYAAGALGCEPVRSQGHVHALSPSCGHSTPELYEIWNGRAVILMQESTGNDPGCCFAVHAGPGEKVVVPPAWAHATISADPDVPLVFGAWCVRDFAFDYTGVRSRGGLAWFPRIEEGALAWDPNPAYPVRRDLIPKAPNPQPRLNLDPVLPIWSQYLLQPGRFDWVPCPQSVATAWDRFVP
ncbi:MAG TPA: glucose-6-phosphate isomerase family protein [Oceanipulchritudo sp.]|nr:glucose-6-phosphate isomerase family protein [Oceanipulchritudo sp.]